MGFSFRCIFMSLLCIEFRIMKKGIKENDKSYDNFRNKTGGNQNGAVGKRTSDKKGN